MPEEGIKASVKVTVSDPPKVKAKSTEQDQEEN